MNGLKTHSVYNGQAQLFVRRKKGGTPRGATLGDMVKSWCKHEGGLRWSLVNAQICLLSLELDLKKGDLWTCLTLFSFILDSEQYQKLLSAPNSLCMQLQTWPLMLF